MANKKLTTRRFSRSDWLDHGLAQLARVGPSGLTIDALCQSTGKTKGSFYSHFTNVSDFVAQLARRWQTQHTSNVIAVTQRVGHLQRRELLDSLALGLDHQLEKNI